MHVKIYQPSQNAMQSGQSKAGQWVLEYISEATHKAREPLMGWISSANTLAQLKLVFESADEAIAYAVREGLSYEVAPVEPKPKRARLSYSENFSYKRQESWTH